MNHKDLLDAVVNNMASPNANIPQQPSQEEIDKSIHLELSTGDTFLVDTRNFDWNKAIKNLDQMTENETAFLNIVHSCINPSNDDTYNEWLKAMIINLTDYMKGYEIDVDYKTINPNLSDRDIVMLMAFDANNITRTMKYHVMKVMYDTNYVSDEPSEKSNIDNCIENTDPLKEWVDSLSKTKCDATTWKCTLLFDSEGIPVYASMTKTDDFSPDEYMIVHREDDTSESVIVSADSEYNAWLEAKTLFDDIAESSSIIIDELFTRDDLYDDEPYEDEDEDGELDEFDPTVFGFTNSELTQMNNKFLSDMSVFIKGILSPDEVEYIMNASINPADDKLKEIEKKLDDAGYNQKLMELSQSIFNNNKEDNE